MLGGSGVSAVIVLYVGRNMTIGSTGCILFGHIEIPESYWLYQKPFKWSLIATTTGGNLCRGTRVRV